MSNTIDCHDLLEKFFEKKFQYKKPQPSDGDCQQWKLPPIGELYKEFYQFEELQKLKVRLNGVKSKLNYYTAEEWSAHTKRTNPAGEVTWRLKNETKAEFVTVAWCKFFECLQRYSLVTSPVLNSLHLCEAPGAFIAALNHYLYSTYNKDQVTWSWRATTMNPYYEGNPLNKMIIDDRFMLDTLDNWIFHEDLTGNIISIKNIEQMERNCLQIFSSNVQLITADGSIDCAEVPDCQEDYVSKLHFAEIITALSILSTGGNFVVKMFTMFEACSVCVMYLLNCAFDVVHIFKPATSKHGNSEVYVICLGYNKDTPFLADTIKIMKTHLSVHNPNDIQMFAKAHLPRDFLVQHEICCRLFMNLQIQAIEGNIYAFNTKSRSHTKFTHELRRLVSNEYYQRYAVQPLPVELCILSERNNIAACNKTDIRKGSYAEREIIKQLDINEHIFRLRGDLNLLEKASSNFQGNVLFQNEAVKTSCIQVSTGAAITELRSSMFASSSVLLLRSHLHTLFKSDPIWCLSPKCVINEEETLTYDNMPSAEFSKTQKTFFVNLIEVLLRDKLPCHKVMFSGFPFLTHLSVSILRFLSTNIYEKMEVGMAPNFTITLTNSRSDESYRQLNRLLEVLRSDAEIHSVLKITELHRNRFAKILIKYNDSILIEGFKRVLDE